MVAMTAHWFLREKTVILPGLKLLLQTRKKRLGFGDEAGQVAGTHWAAGNERRFVQVKLNRIVAFFGRSHGLNVT